MSVLLIITDGMADEPIASLNNRTPLEVAHTPHLDQLASFGQNGLLTTVPPGWEVGSDTACLSILGYSLDASYPGRSALEAAQLGITIGEDECVFRCNLITVEKDRITSFTADHISTDEADVLIQYLNEHLKDFTVEFFSGNSYRHILKTKGNSKLIRSNPPHNSILVTKNCLDLVALNASEESNVRKLNNVIEEAQKLLSNHPINIERVKRGLKPANAISLWAPGSTPQLSTFSTMYPFKNGVIISAVDLIKGIGKLIGFDTVAIKGATGQANTNYKGKLKACLDALKTYDFVILHIEAPDEASHDGDVKLKIKTIEDIDQRIVKPLLTRIENDKTPPLVALLPDHITSTAKKVHCIGDVPFVLYHPSLTPDKVHEFTEESAKLGVIRITETKEFMQLLVKSSLEIDKHY